MQVLVLAVQNAVDYSVLGAATSGVTMFRGIGGSLGAAVFGRSSPRGLPPSCAARSAGRSVRRSPTEPASPAHRSRACPQPRELSYEHAYVHALQPVFLAAAGVAGLGFALSWLLQERPLRETAATSTGLDDSLAAPRSPDSLAEIERSPRTRRRRGSVRQRFAERLWPSAHRSPSARAPRGRWCASTSTACAGARAGARDESACPRSASLAVVAELREHGLIAGEDGAGAHRPRATALAERAVAARRELLSEALADESAARDPAVDELLRRLARELCGEPPPSRPRRRGPSARREPLRERRRLGRGRELAAHPHVLDAGLA